MNGGQEEASTNVSAVLCVVEEVSNISEVLVAIRASLRFQTVDSEKTTTWGCRCASNRLSPIIPRPQPPNAIPFRTSTRQTDRRE